MANIAIMRTYFQDVINVSAETARWIVDQGLDDFDTLKDFSESDMKTLCATARYPGGMIPNPTAHVAGQAPTIRDPGHVITMVAEKRLIMTAYAAMHQTCTSRPINARTMTRPSIMSLAPLRELELAYSDPTPIDKPLKDTPMPKWLESLDDYLLKRRGVNKTPLAYVKRESVAVLGHADDPSTGYANVDEEMIARAPHDLYVFGADSKSLWHVLHDSLKDHPAYTSIRAFSRTQDGRGAHMSLVLHNLGESRNSSVLEEAEDNLNNVTYTEEKLKFSFDRFVEIHRSAHNDMLSVPNFVVPNPATRVRKLLSNIRSTNPKLLASIASVETSAILRNDFEQAVDTLQAAIRSMKVSTARKQRISALTGGRGGRGGRGNNTGRGGRGARGGRFQRGGKRGRSGGRGGGNKRARFSDEGDPPHGVDWIEDKFYEVSYYSKFTPEQKSRVHELRANRNDSSQNVSSVETRLQQLENFATGVAPPTSSPQIVPVHQNIAQVSNANNPALQRLNQRS